MIKYEAISVIVAKIPVKVGRIARIAVEVATDEKRAQFVAETSNKRRVSMYVRYSRRLDQVHVFSHDSDRILTSTGHNRFIQAVQRHYSINERGHIRIARIEWVYVAYGHGWECLNRLQVLRHARHCSIREIRIQCFVYIF